MADDLEKVDSSLVDDISGDLCPNFLELPLIEPAIMMEVLVT